MALVRCCLQRALVSFSPRICHKNKNLTIDSDNLSNGEQLSICFSARHYSFAHSPYLGDMKIVTDYEIFKDPPEWKYVENLLPKKTVPIPIPKDSYPSGWIPPKPEALNEPYFIARTKNYMMPVYVCNTFKGIRKITKVRKIEGDIWALNLELKAYLKNKHNRIISTRVHELARHIEVKGDFALDTQEFLYSKGF